MRWDKYFYNICEAVASNSKCLSRQIGAIIVRDRSIVSTGYNGPARGVPHCPTRLGDMTLLDELTSSKNFLEPNRCPRSSLGYKSGEGLHLCIAAHAEANAIVNAARLGVSICNCEMYLNTQVPCKNCMDLIINSGIFRVTCTDKAPYDALGKWKADNAGIEIRTFNLE